MEPAVATQATISDKQQGIFYMCLPIDRTAHTTSFDGPAVDQWLERKIAQTENALAMMAWSDDRNLYRRVLYHLSYILPHILSKNSL